MTPEAAIVNVILSHLEELTFSPDDIDKVGPNVSYDPAFSDPYIQSQLLPNTTGRPFLGLESSDEFLGLLQVTVVYKAARGIIDPTELAGLVIGHFPKGTSLRSEDPPLTVRITGRGSIAPNPIQDADRFRLPVTIPYQAFYRKA